MRASLFRRRPVQLTRLTQKFVPSAGAPGSYSLTVTSLSMSPTFTDVTLTFTGNYSLVVDSLSIPVTRNNVNLIWVGAPAALSTNNKLAISMKMGL